MSFPIIFAAGVIVIGLLLLIKALVPSFQFSTFKFIAGIEPYPENWTAID